MDNDDIRTCSIFEELEPRILMSGTPAPAPVSDYFVQAEVFSDQVEEEKQVSEILFIDSGVKDYDSLIDGLNRNVEVVLLNDDEDGIDKISSVLEGRKGISAIHILSHGDSGEISIGNANLNSENINLYESQLRNWASALSEEADILIYGCNVGQDSSFLGDLANFTSADVAASDDLTGSEFLGGDADLEVNVGHVTVESFFNQSEFNQAGVVLLDAVDDDYTVSDPTNEDTILNVAAEDGILSNDDDTDASIIGYDTSSANGASVTVNADGSFSYDPTSSAFLQTLDEGQPITDTFTYTLGDNATAPDALMNVQFINTSGTNPGGSSANWQSLWDELAGTNTTGNIVTSTGTYNVLNNNSDTETVFDYNSGGDFGINRNINSINGDGPEGSGGATANANYSIRVNTFLKFQTAGTYTIAMGSDDGRQLELKEASTGSAPGFTGFTSRGDQVNGSFTPGDTIIGHDGNTAHNQSLGTFTVDAGDILELTAFYYETTSGSSGEFSIANGTFSSFTDNSDFSLLTSGASGILLASDFDQLNQAITAEIGIVSLTVNGSNDAPVAVNNSNSITELIDDTTTVNAVNGNFFTDGTDDSDVDDTIASFSISQVSNASSGIDLSGTIVGQYGSLTWTPNAQGTGAYTYTLDDSNSDVQAMIEGQTLQETFTYTLSDNHATGNAKTDTAILTITINGANDTLIAENNSASVVEDSGVNQVASGNLISDDDSIDSNADGVSIDIDVDSVDLNIIDVTNATSGTDTSGTIIGEHGTLSWDKDTGAYTYTLNNGTDGVSSVVQDLKEGEQLTDIFTYKLHNGFVSGDSLMNVQYVSASGSTPGNDTANWLSVWDELAGTNTTGDVLTSTGTYNITNNHSDTETVFDYGTGGNYNTNTGTNTINNDGSGGGASSVAADHYSIRTNSFLAFNVGGTYTIAMGSDDGRRIELSDATPGGSGSFNGFSSRAEQVNGSFTPGDTVIGFSGGTGHEQTLGTFTVEAGDILELNAFFYEGTGGDSGELSIAFGEFSNFNTSDFQLITDEQFNIAVSSVNNFTKAAVGFAETETDTATLTVTITGTNDAPVIELAPSPIDISDLSGWTSDNNPPTGVGLAPPVWNVSGASVTQTINSRPAVLQADFEIESDQYSGELNIVTSSGNDDDALGFVLGYQDDGLSNTEDGFILVDWNRLGDNHGQMGLKSKGLAVSFVQGEDIEGTDYWGHTGDVTEIARATNLGSSGFTAGVSNNFKFTVNGDNLQIFVDDVLEFDLDAADFGLTAFPLGSFGFYNFAQENVTYEMVSLNLDGNSAVSFREGDSPVVIVPTMDVTDIEENYDGGTLTVEITSNAAPSEDLLATALDFSTFATLDGSSTDQKLVFNLNALADSVNVKGLIESITYENTTDKPSILTREVTFTLEDNESASNTEVKNILVSGVNAAPVVNVSTGSFSVDEEATVAITGLSLTDTDSANDDLQLTLTVANGTLNINDPNSGAVSGSNLIISGTLTELNATLTALTYTPEDDFSGQDTLNIEMSDLGNHDGVELTDTGSISIDVNPLSDVLIPAIVNTNEDLAVDFSITSTDADEDLIEILFTDVTNGTISGDDVTDLGGGQFRWQKPEFSPTFDLNDFVMNSHSDQDLDPTDFTVSGDGTSIELTGNTWKNIDINYTVTANTVLEFDMKSVVEPEISMILFDNDNLFGAGGKNFVMHGAQNFNDSAGGAFNNYDGSGDFKFYSIRVGDFFTGDFSKLVFANDDDRSGAPGDTTYRNVRLFEDTPLAAVDFTFTPTQDLEVDTFVNVTVQSRDGGELISKGPQRLDLTINKVNDTPVISVTGGDTDSAAFIETNTGLNRAGTLTVLDVDLADTVNFSTSAVSVSGASAGLGVSSQELLSMLSVSGSIDNVSTTSALNWTFDSGNEAFDFLATGESLVLTYTLQALDDSGINTSLDTHDIVITITGTNDQPIASNSAVTISEDTSSFQRDLSAKSNERDFSDRLSVENLTVSVLGPLDDDLVFDLDESGILSLDPSQFNYMKEGEKLTIVFVYSLVDDSGVGAGNANDAADSKTDTFTLIVDGKREATPPVVVVDEIVAVGSIEESESLVVEDDKRENVALNKKLSGTNDKSSFSFLSKGSSVHFNEKFLSDDSLNVIRPIFNQNSKSESEVAQTEDHTVTLEDIDVFDTPLLPLEELNFIEDLKVEVPVEDDSEKDDEVSYHSSDESMHEIASQKKEKDFKVLTQYNLDTQINLNESLIGDFDCFDTSRES